MTSRDPRGWSVVLGIGVTLLLALPTAAAAPAPRSAGPFHAPVHGGTPCEGAAVASAYRGQLNVTDPYESLPSVANRTIVASYDFQENLSSGSSVTLSCQSYNVSASTDASGGFALTAKVPPGRCGNGYCQVDTGPFGPISFRMANASPPGDLLRVALRGTFVGLLWTEALASVSISPSGAQVLSAEAPTNFTAVALAGDGGPSPAALAIHWVVRGGGWSILGNASESALRIVGGPHASSGALDLFSNGSYNGTGFAFAPFVDALSDVVTNLTSASLTPSSLDAGYAASVQLQGSGAAGYTYTATLDPGTELAAQSVPCTASLPDLLSVVELRCQGSYTYASSGNETPRITLTNGYSQANRTLEEVGVAPSLSVSVVPTPASGYVGRPILLSVAVAAGTGTAPYGPVCLSNGAGTFSCLSGGPSPWNLTTRYEAPGSYSALASVADAAGWNRTLAIPVQVAGAPDLGAIQAPTNVVNSSTALELSAPYEGGVLPARFWWNDSITGAPVSSGVLGSDGTLGLRFATAEPGIHLLELTVLDGLGTRNSSTITVSVNAGPAVALESAGPSSPPTVDAGTAANLSVRMIDPTGATVTAFAGEVPVTLEGPGNLSTARWSYPGGGGPAPASGPLILPRSAWSQGYLNFSLTVQNAGLWNVSLGGAGLPGPVLELSIPVTADPRTARLLDPTTVHPGSRENSTLWAVQDRYGNPILQGYVIVRSSFPSALLVVDSQIEAAGGSGHVWVNVTPLDDGAGTVIVLNPYNGLPLLPAIAVPAAPAPSLPLTTIALVGVGAALVAVGVAAVARRTVRRRALVPDPSQELERHAAGRDHLLRRLAEGPTASWRELAYGWTGPLPPPGPAEVGGWLASLVAEGAVRANLGPGGRPVFALVGDADAPPGLTLDAEALERALARRGGEPPSRDPADARP